MKIFDFRNRLIEDDSTYVRTSIRLDKFHRTRLGHPSSFGGHE